MMEYRCILVVLNIVVKGKKPSSVYYGLTSKVKKLKPSFQLNDAFQNVVIQTTIELKLILENRS